MSAISLCMIVRDEERFLPSCLESVRDVVDEIIVVDTGSRDATVSIAERFGAKIVHYPWQDDFAAARNQAVAAATGRWMLALDADERLDPETASRVREAVAAGNWEIGFLQFVNIHEQGARGREWIAPRLFRLTPGLRYIGRIHEQVVQSGSRSRTRIIDAAVYHYGYQTEVYQDRGKRARNSRLLEAALEDPEAQDPLLRTNYLFHHANLATGRELLERYEKFAAYIREHWARDRPRVPWITGGLAEYARLLNDVGRHHEAREVAEDLLTNHGASPALHYYIARARAAEGDLAGAECELEFVLRPSPCLADEHRQYTQDLGLIRGRAQFLFGLIRENQGLIEEAVSHYQAAVEEEPGQPLLRNHWTCALVRLGRLREALVALEPSAPDPGADCLGLALSLITQSVGRLGFWGERVRQRAQSFPPATRMLDRVAQLGPHWTFRLEDFPEIASAVLPAEDPGRVRMPQTAR